MRFVRIVFVVALIVYSFVIPGLKVNYAYAAGEPTVEIDAIPDYVAALDTLSGTASDDGTVNKVQVQI